MAVRGLRVGLLGGGLRSAVGRAHVGALALAKGVQLVGGAFSSSSAVSKSSAVAYGLPAESGYASLAEMIERAGDRIDAISIVTPTPNHASQVSEVLAAGLQVICEKSLAESVEEAKVLVRDASQRQLGLWVTFNYSGYPMIRQIRELVRSGALGEIHSLELQMPQQGFLVRDEDGESPRVQAWRAQDRHLWGVSLDLGVHLAHLLEFTSGLAPVAVVAKAGHWGNVGNVTDVVHGMGTLSNGGTMSLRYGKAFAGERNGLGIELWGTQGAVSWKQSRPEEVVMADLGGRRTLLDNHSSICAVARQDRYMRFKSGHPSGFIEAFANVYEDIAEAALSEFANCSTEPQYAPSGHDALRGLLLLDALQSSHEQGTWAAVETPGLSA